MNWRFWLTFLSNHNCFVGFASELFYCQLYVLRFLMELCPVNDSAVKNVHPGRTCWAEPSQALLANPRDSTLCHFDNKFACLLRFISSTYIDQMLPNFGFLPPKNTSKQKKRLFHSTHSKEFNKFIVLSPQTKKTMLFPHQPKHPTVGTGLSKLPWQGVFCLNQGFTLAQARGFLFSTRSRHL